MARTQVRNAHQRLTALCPRLAVHGPRLAIGRVFGTMPRPTACLGRAALGADRGGAERRGSSGGRGQRGGDGCRLGFMSSYRLAQQHVVGAPHPRDVGQDEAAGMARQARVSAPTEPWHRYAGGAHGHGPPSSQRTRWRFGPAAPSWRCCHRSPWSRSPTPCWRTSCARSTASPS